METIVNASRTIYLGGGCFWCTEAIFKRLRGVLQVTPGYMGGSVPNPSYEAVCSGATGHAEVVKIEYDESIISTSEILDVFFGTHNPTTPDRQGADQGSQYRSIVFYTSNVMRETIAEAIARKQAQFPENILIVTHIAEAVEFYSAEEYHHNYYELNKDAPYCQVVINPKLGELQKLFTDKVVPLQEEVKGS